MFKSANWDAIAVDTLQLTSGEYFETLKFQKKEQSFFRSHYFDDNDQLDNMGVDIGSLDEPKRKNFRR